MDEKESVRNHHFAALLQLLFFAEKRELEGWLTGHLNIAWWVFKQNMINI